MKRRSPRVSRSGSKRGSTASGRATNARITASTIPSTQVSRPRSASRDRQPERDEHGDLGEDADRRQEALDLALAQHRGVAEDDSRDEDRQETRAARDGGDAVDEPRDGEHPDRVQREPRQADATEDRPREKRACDADREPDAHLDRELADDDPEAAVVLLGELDHPDHQRDPDRVVHPGLALRIVPERPRISRPAKTENVTAGSVGAIAAPTSPASIQLKPST